MFNLNQPISAPSWYSNWFTGTNGEPEAAAHTSASAPSLTSSRVFEDESVEINRGSSKENCAIEWRQLQSTIECFEATGTHIGSKAVEVFLHFITQGTKNKVFCDLLCDNPNSRKIQELLSCLPAKTEGSFYLPLALENPIRSRAAVGGAVDALTHATGIPIAPRALVMIALDFENKRLEYFDPAGYTTSEKEMRQVAGLEKVPLATLLAELEKKYDLEPKERVASPAKWYSYGTDFSSSCCWYVQKRIEGQTPDALFAQTLDATAMRMEMAQGMRSAQKSIELDTPIEIFLQSGEKGTVTMGLVKDFPHLINEVLSSLDTPDKIAKQLKRDIPTIAHLKVGGKEILPATFHQRAQVREALQRITWYQIDSTEYNKVLDRILTAIETWEESSEKNLIAAEVTKLRKEQTRTGERFRQKIREVESIKEALVALEQNEEKQDLYSITSDALREMTGNNEKAIQTLLALSTQTTLGGEIMFLAGMGQGSETIPHHELIGYSVDINKNEAEEMILTITRGYHYFDEKGYRFTGDLNINVNVTTGYASAWLDPRMPGLF